MTRKKIPAQTGCEPRIFRSRGGRLNHLANEAVNNGNAEEDGEMGRGRGRESSGNSRTRVSRAKRK